MRRRSKSNVLMILFVIATMLFVSSTTTYAATKDVTKQKKASVAKFLNPHSAFLEYPLEELSGYKAVKFDDYYKTNMLLFSKIYCSYGGWNKYCNKPISVSQKAFTPQFRKMFGNAAKFKVKKGYGHRYPNLYSIVNGKLSYIGGDFGDVTVYGKVRKVYKTGTNKYMVKYSVYKSGWSRKSEPNRDIDGTYSIYLKAKGSSYTITNIKLSERAVWRNGNKVYSGSKVKMMKCQK